jgi:carbonic anhydrase
MELFNVSVIFETVISQNSLLPSRYSKNIYTKMFYTPPCPAVVSWNELLLLEIVSALSFSKDRCRTFLCQMF